MDRRTASDAARSPAPWRVAVAMGVALLLGACANLTSPRSDGGAAADAERLERFLAAAGEPVPSFRMVRFADFTPLGERHLAVWTRRDEAWLLRVDAPCIELPWEPQLGISSSLGRVYSGVDRVTAGRDQCRIREIRPVDVSRLRAAATEARGTLEVQDREGDGAGAGVNQGAGGT